MSKEEFWHYFEENKGELEKVILGKTSDMAPYEALSDKLKSFNSFLLPELTIDPDNKFIIIISCDGMKQGIPFVELLTEDIRQISNWKIVKYRQPGPMDWIPLDGIKVRRNAYTVCNLCFKTLFQFLWWLLC